MTLFDVPGWSVSATPAREESHRLSKKRKRPSNKQLKSAEVNVEKLMAQLVTSPTEATSSHVPESKRRKKNHYQEDTSKAGAAETKIQPTSSSRKAEKTKASAFNSKIDNDPTATVQTNSKKKSLKIEKQTVISSSPLSNLTSLQKTMKESLDGARFRIINENLYKTDSRQAHEMMRTDPKVFEEYHSGFRHQVISWPVNPVEHFVANFETYPKKTVIADLGCGDAALAKALVPKGLSVISFDLVSDNEFVVEADICHKIPLPGSEECGQPKSTGAGQIVDIVVCALSLMGVNWPSCIREAWRILKAGGELHIAEVTSRFTDIEAFQNLLGSLGFRLKSKNDSISSHFVLFEFVKVPRSAKTEKEWIKLLSKGALLKPCEYKRR